MWCLDAPLASQLAVLQAVLTVTTSAARTYADGQGLQRWAGLLPIVADGLDRAPACMAANHRDLAAAGAACLSCILGALCLPP